MFEVIGVCLIIIGVIWLFIPLYLARYNNNFPKSKREGLSSFCILIPARDESNVIEDLLKSINSQTKKVNMNNVFVIVESTNDPTVKIANNYNANIFIRKELHLKSKGYALNEVIKDLCKKNNYYDAYFIFDADNVLDKDYFKNIEKSYIAGYDIATGFRNLKNGNTSIISACSGITFSFLNTSGNNIKTRQSRNITLSGTGLYITGDLIKKWQGFPFHSLTEDYELTLYSILHNLTSAYNNNAIFYDEQPTIYKNTINQRIRWIKGYFSCRKKYIPNLRKTLTNNPNFASSLNEITGMKPYIIMIIGAMLYILNQLIFIIQIHDLTSILTLWCFIKIFIILLLAYFLFSMMTLFVILKDKDKINLNSKMRLKTIFFSPIFFLTYVPCAIKALLKKNVSWEKVEHNSKWHNKS